MNSAKRHLPCFAGNPPYDTTQTTQLMQSVLRAQPGYNAAPPTWAAFLRALRQPKDKSADPEVFSAHLLSHLPQVLQWDLYQVVIHTWAPGQIPQAWLQSRISLLYKKGPTRSATNYRPISVNHSLYVILAKLILNAIQQPLDASLSPHQYGSRKGHTPTKQAIQLLTTLSTADEPVICLLDIAKAFPSTPHDSIHTALELIGTPQSIKTLIKSIYQGSTNQYQNYQYKLTRGIKEGCPLSPSLFVLVYEAFHATLSAEFPDVHFFYICGRHCDCCTQCARIAPRISTH